jgi:hypothetical protein
LTAPGELAQIRNGLELYKEVTVAEHPLPPSVLPDDGSMRVARGKNADSILDIVSPVPKGHVWSFVAIGRVTVASPGQHSADGRMLPGTEPP